MLFAVFFSVLLLTDRVDILEPRQRMVLNSAELRRLCASGDHVFACTRFAEERLECHCLENQSLWYEVLTAHLAPEMLLSKPYDARHERVHLDDLRRRLQSYVLDAGVVGYASARDCELAASARTASFHDVMNGFRRASNELYH